MVNWTQTKLLWNVIIIENSLFKTVNFNISSAKWRPFRLGLNVLKQLLAKYYTVWGIYMFWSRGVRGMHPYIKCSPYIKRHYIRTCYLAAIVGTTIPAQYISWASYQIRKIASVHAPGMPGTFSPPLRVSDPDMYHGTCVTHVPWCMPISPTSDFLWSQRRGETFPAFPVHAQPAILRIWQEAHRICIRLCCALLCCVIVYSLSFVDSCLIHLPTFFRVASLTGVSDVILKDMGKIDRYQNTTQPNAAVCIFLVYQYLSYYVTYHVIMMPTLSSLVAPQVAMTTAYGATSDSKVGIITIIGFQPVKNGNQNEITGTRSPNNLQWPG